MQRLFRSFERSGLEYLLISGQASILYGAATFSEDVDIWIRPTAANAKRLVRAMTACRARIHKLTPPLSPRWMRSGHGFHFVVPAGSAPIYLDVMGQPPRVGAFQASHAKRNPLPTPWGILPVVSIEDLVELKKTRRLSDYEVISNLVRVRVSGILRPTKSLLRWAARNSFRAEDRREYRKLLGQGGDLEECRRSIAAQVANLQRKDVRYWGRIVRDLRKLRRAGGLLQDGSSVSRLR